tara:strand:+ start:1434 stop:1724 length:291 start_codon:yes stop_codon:yes gene_type:complete
MNLEYTYEIISVDALAQCMVVKYSSAEREPFIVGVRLPFEGEPLEDVIESFSPMAHWLSLEAKRDIPVVGTSGVIKPVEVIAEPEAEEHVFPVSSM